VPRQQVIERLAAGDDVVVRTDVQGAATIKKLMPEAVLIFIAPSSLAEIEERIRARGSDDEARIQRRLQTAAAEMARQGEFDYVVINETGRLDRTAARVLEILDAERGRAMMRHGAG
jgi:guanylate kinase